MRLVALLCAAALASACGSDSTSQSSSGVTPDDTGAADSGPPTSLGDVRDGVATYYAATGEGNCSFDASPGDLDVAAMDAPEWANSAVCGMCVHVVGPSGAVTVRIVDQCPGCEKSHLDLSESAFAKIADPTLGRVPIQWQPVACAVSGPIAYKFKEGSNQWWTAIQVRNHRIPIAKLEVNVGGTWTSIDRVDYNYFVASSGLGPGPYSLRVTDALGASLQDDGIALTPGGVVNGAAQFP
jgi:expansin (peptidoglycan-binding protein)